jgi:DNA topoisomerase IB
MAEHGMLNATPEYTAAQEEGINMERAGRGAEYDRADQSIVSKTIFDVDGKALALPGLQKLGNLVFAAAQGGEVELIRALGQLRDTGQLLGRRRRDINGELQSGKKSLECRCLLAKSFALLVFAIERGTLTIFFCHSAFVERPHIAQKVGNLFRSRQL